MKDRQHCILVNVSIYLIALAVYMLIRQVSWLNDTLWNIFPGFTLPVIIPVSYTHLTLPTTERV